MTKKIEKDLSFTIYPIGFVRSDDQKGRYEIELLPRFSAGLEKL